MRGLIQQFVAVSLAMFVGVWAALLTYEKWIVAPRKEREAAAVASTFDALNSELKELRAAAQRDLAGIKARSPEARSTVDAKAGAPATSDALGDALKSGAPVKPAEKDSSAK
jgi:hypothetical protein